VKQVDIKIEKTARYFVSGTPSDKITDVWFVCHGYGQLAKYFIKWFEPILNESTLIIAPEGLSRFYWNGFSGNVVASWMTKEERNSDIDDYVQYLDKVANEVLKKVMKVNINILGFSQGASTASRWAALGKTTPSNLILWAGSFPTDISYLENIEAFNKFSLHFLIGDTDELFSEKIISQYMKEFKEKEISFKLFRYKGGHKILPQPLLKLQKHLSR
jgi:predicted esterase